MQAKQNSPQLFAHPFSQGNNYNNHPTALQTLEKLMRRYESPAQIRAKPDITLCWVSQFLKITKKGDTSLC